MRTLKEIFDNPKLGLAHKWPHYFKIYEEFFEKIRNKELIMLEIGVSKGGSLWMWKEFFPNSKIVGIDINPDAKKYEGEGIKIHIGDQTDKKFLEKVSQESGPFDIILDDGGHKMKQVIISCQTLFPLLKNDGIYLIEDLHTSYWKKWGGKYKKRGTSIEFLKGLVDCINYRRHDKDQENPFNRILESMHFFESIAILKKTKSSDVVIEEAIKSEKYELIE